MIEMTWQEVVIALQGGAELLGRLSQSSLEPAGAPGLFVSRPAEVLLTLNGEPISAQWRYTLPFDMVRSSPGGPGNPFRFYLTERGKAFRLDGE